MSSGLIPEITIEGEPSAAAPSAPVPDADGIMTVTDVRGRVIKIKRVKPGQKMNLFKVAGGELAANGPFFSYVMVAASVIEIAGDPITFPASLLQVQAIIQRLDDDGIDAVAKGLLDASAAETERMRAMAKNS